jgi:putative PIN family toxin of toxin-antitoxin system
MQKVVIDTNVIISSLIQQSFPYKIVTELFIESKITLCVSQALMTEYYDVLRRPKFTAFYDFVARAEALLADIETKAFMYFPEISLDLLSDKDDNKILELADVCKADFIITGNTTDFTFPIYPRTRLVTPTEYYLMYYPY